MEKAGLVRNSDLSLPVLARLGARPVPELKQDMVVSETMKMDKDKR
jgi:hypothetical protein